MGNCRSKIYFPLKFIFNENQPKINFLSNKKGFIYYMILPAVNILKATKFQKYKKKFPRKTTIQKYKKCLI